MFARSTRLNWIGRGWDRQYRSVDGAPSTGSLRFALGQAYVVDTGRAGAARRPVLDGFDLRAIRLGRRAELQPEDEPIAGGRGERLGTGHRLAVPLECRLETEVPAGTGCSNPPMTTASAGAPSTGTSPRERSAMTPPSASRNRSSISPVPALRVTPGPAQRLLGGVGGRLPIERGEAAQADQPRRGLLEELGKVHLRVEPPTTSTG